jgi:SAM-dependent methyltransferase
MSTNYWKEYWEKTHSANSDDLQVQVARTRMGNPIDQESWYKTLRYVEELLEIQPTDTILDACGGNGLFAIRFQEVCHQTTVVDVNAGLLENLVKNSPGIEVIHADLIEYLKNSGSKFEKILFYAGIQYFSELETFQVLEKFREILKPGGILFIGDIPDFNKRDSFMSTDDRYQRYFENLKDGKETIGTWFTFDWLSALSEYLGYESCTLKIQPGYQIYSDFRFDALIRG